ncbi:MAG TPA: N-acetylglutaminylglutamine synthetase [Gammaproteobacteria bacterium]|nr:N-acetylglutaminylglutamine synthetase [Gammaproteobacteria bacterium]
MMKRHRFDRRQSPSLKGWQSPNGPAAGRPASDVVIDVGWGRLIFAHTFSDNKALARTLCQEAPGRRDIAMYLRDPHVVISMAPQELFLDPSHTFRLWLERYQTTPSAPKGFVVRKMLTKKDAKSINNIYAGRHMVTVKPAFLWEQRDSRLLTYAVAEDEHGSVIGTAMGIDHVEAFGDPEHGASLWCLAVDPQAPQLGVGEALVRFMIEHYMARGRSYMDLSVMHDNTQAIGLYEKLGFVRVPVFTLKHKNPINEPLFIATPLEEKLNPYAAIIVNEARRRGIAVEVLDEDKNYVALSFGGRTIICRESLSELTTAVAMSICDDKQMTLRVLSKAGINIPAQQQAGAEQDNLAFLDKHRHLVVKPARGEQGVGISIDVSDAGELKSAVQKARKVCENVMLEQYVKGEDLRIIVINDSVVAAAVRRPPRVIGTGHHSIRQLIKKQSRRRAAATGGESHIPIDEETKRCIHAAGHELDEVLPEGQELTVRRTPNLHAGGTIHDVTARLHPTLAEAAVEAARAIQIPVVGLDFIVPDVEQPYYVAIEANERPGLANHEPQPTAERFIDLLFPQMTMKY